MSFSHIESITVPPELEAEMTPAVRAFVKTLLDRIKQLERGQKTPQNSSLPPSSQHPHARPQPTKRKSKKKRGGQPGHEKHERSLIPTEECNKVQPLKPAECRRCGAEWGKGDISGDKGTLLIIG
jgi:transposase